MASQLSQLITQLSADYGVATKDFATSNPDVFTIDLEKDFRIELVDTHPVLLIKADIAPIPKGRTELFVTNAMLANLFGQGTEAAILGATSDGLSLRLSLPIDYPIDFKQFKGLLEEFIRVADFWRNEAAKK